MVSKVTLIIITLLMYQGFLYMLTIYPIVGAAYTGYELKGGALDISGNPAANPPLNYNPKLVPNQSLYNSSFLPQPSTNLGNNPIGSVIGAIYGIFIDVWTGLAILASMVSQFIIAIIYVPSMFAPLQLPSDIAWFLSAPIYLNYALLIFRVLMGREL